MMWISVMCDTCALTAHEYGTRLVLMSGNIVHLQWSSQCALMISGVPTCAGFCSYESMLYSGRWHQRFGWTYCLRVHLDVKSAHSFESLVPAYQSIAECHDTRKRRLILHRQDNRKQSCISASCFTSLISLLVGKTVLRTSFSSLKSLKMSFTTCFCLK
jgi:hypothetical protein